MVVATLAAALAVGMVVGALAWRRLSSWLEAARRFNVMAVEIPKEDFDRLLAEVVIANAANLLSVPGVYEPLADRFGAEVLKRWQEEQSDQAPRELKVWINTGYRLPADKLRHHPAALALGSCPSCGGSLTAGVAADGTLAAMICQNPKCGAAWMDE